MKKLSILIVAVAMMAMTACNEKPAKNNNGENGTATEQQTTPNAAEVPPMEKAAPTDDGKDHNVAKFNTKEYEISVDNLADGTYRVTMSKDGKAEQVYETKNCQIQGDSYLMRTDDGKNLLINGKDGKIVILNNKEIIYRGAANM